MLEIRVNNQALDLRGVSIQLTLRNPIFYRGDDGSFSYSFSLPATARNKDILGFTHRLTSFTQPESFDNCTIHLDGISFGSGILVIDKYNGSEFEVNLGLNKGKFNYQAGKKSLKELVWPVQHFNRNPIGQSGSILNVCNFSWPTVKFAYFPVFNEGLYQNSPFFNDYFRLSAEKFIYLVYHWMPGAFQSSYFAQLTTNGIIGNVIDPGGNVIPYQTYWEDLIHKYSGLSNKKQWENKDLAWKNFLFWKEFWMQYASAFPPPTVFNDFENAGLVNTIESHFVPTLNGKAGKFIAPFPYVAEALKEVILQLGYFPGKIKFLEDADLKKLCIVTMNMAYGYGSKDFPTNNLVDVNLQEHLPDLSCREFIDSLCGPFNFTPFLMPDGSFDILHNEDILDSDPAGDFGTGLIIDSTSVKRYFYRLHLDSEDDQYFSENVKQDNLEKYERIADVPLVSFLPNAHTVIRKINVVCYVVQQDRFYITYSDESNILQWRPYSYNHIDFESGNTDEQSVVMEFKTGYLLKAMHMWFPPNSAPVNYTPYSQASWFDCPVCDIAGNQNDHEVAYDASYQQQKLRLMFYRGMRPLITNWDPDNPSPQYWQTGQLLPHGSFDNFYAGSPIQGEKYSLKWDGPEGLVRNFWNKWLYWLNNVARDVSAVKKFTPAQLAAFDLRKKYSADGVNYIVKEIRVDLTENSISPAEVDLVTA